MTRQPGESSMSTGPSFRCCRFTALEDAHGKANAKSAITNVISLEAGSLTQDRNDPGLSSPSHLIHVAHFVELPNDDVHSCVPFRPIERPRAWKPRGSGNARLPRPQMSRLACQLRLDCSTRFEAVAHLHRAGCDPRQNPLDILIREILQSGVRRACKPTSARCRRTS